MCGDGSLHQRRVPSFGVGPWTGRWAISSSPFVSYSSPLSFFYIHPSSSSTPFSLSFFSFHPSSSSTSLPFPSPFSLSFLSLPFTLFSLLEDRTKILRSGRTAVTNKTMNRTCHSCVRKETTSLEQGEVVGEGNHDIAGVLGEAFEGVKRRDDEALGFREEGEEANHGGAAVVDFGLEAAFLFGFGLFGEDVERLVEVQGDLSEALAGDGRVVSRLAALGVVDIAFRVTGAFPVRFEHADEDEDLEFAVEGDVVPLFLGGAARDVAAVRVEGVGAGNEVGGLGAEAEEARHGDAAVLDFRMAKVADGAFFTEAPEVDAGDTEGIPEADGLAEGVGVGFREGDEVGLAEGHLGRRGDGGGGRKGRGGAKGEGEDNGLHLCGLFAAECSFVSGSRDLSSTWLFKIRARRS